MTSASSSSARSLFAESKQRLAERVQVNMNNIASLARQIQRGSKSQEASLLPCCLPSLPPTLLFITPFIAVLDQPELT